MNHNLRSLLVIAALASLMIPAGAASPHNASVSARQQIQRELNLSNTAFAHRDIAGVYRYFAPTYSRIGVDGKTYDLAADEASAREFMTVMKSVSATTTVTHCVVHGTTAAVTVAVDSKVAIKSGRTAPITNVTDDEVRVQSWVRSGSSWLLQTSRNSSTRVTVRTPGQPEHVFVDGKRLK